MDFAEAQVFSRKLLAEKTLAGWELLDLISHGKSAVIMRARSNQAVAAVKVFHPGLIEAYGREAQLIRINRERELIDKRHESIIRILDAGCCESSQHLYVAMELAEGRQLSKVLSKIPRKNIARLIEQLARAAKQLEDWGFTHRDIKPDNIHIFGDDLASLLLLDFGVLKPYGNDAATSQQVSKAFIGTHQYCPSEMIHGREEDTLNGWRAITFYQIGAVLHDLIARKPIFQSATNRHADLVVAIDNDAVVLTSDEVDPILCNLANRCLLKNPQDRLELVKWQDFMFSDQALNAVSLQDRRDTLLRQIQLGRALTHVDVFEDGEKRRLKQVRLQSAMRCAKAKFDQALADLGDLMPPRTTILDGGAHPSPAVTYSFVAASTLRLTLPFRIQIAVALHDDRDAIDLYARASKGVDATEDGWVHLGLVTENFDRTSDVFQEWMIRIIEELISQ